MGHGNTKLDLSKFKKGLYLESNYSRYNNIAFLQIKDEDINTLTNVVLLNVKIYVIEIELIGAILWILNNNQQLV